MKKLLLVGQNFYKFWNSTSLLASSCCKNSTEFESALPQYTFGTKSILNYL